MKIKTVAAAKKKFAGMGINPFAAAMMRNLTYKKGKRTVKNREILRAELLKAADEIVESGGYKSERVGKKAHIANIKKLAKKVEKKCSGFLLDGKLHFGTAQKYFNLELKLRWCRNECTEPPHCPFDRIVLVALRVKGTCRNWTECKDATCYDEWVDAFEDDKARVVALVKLRVKSIAEWELLFWLQEWLRREKQKRH